MRPVARPARARIGPSCGREAREPRLDELLRLRPREDPLGVRKARARSRASGSPRRATGGRSCRSSGRRPSAREARAGSAPSAPTRSCPPPHRSRTRRRASASGGRERRRTRGRSRGAPRRRRRCRPPRGGRPRPRGRGGRRARRGRRPPPSATGRSPGGRRRRSGSGRAARLRSHEGSRRRRRRARGASSGFGRRAEKRLEDGGRERTTSGSASLSASERNANGQGFSFPVSRSVHFSPSTARTPTAPSAFAVFTFSDQRSSASPSAYFETSSFVLPRLTRRKAFADGDDLSLDVETLVVVPAGAASRMPKPAKTTGAVTLRAGCGGTTTSTPERNVRRCAVSPLRRSSSTDPPGSRISRIGTGWKNSALADGVRRDGATPARASWAAAYSSAASRPRLPRPRPSSAGDARKRTCAASASVRSASTAARRGSGRGSVGPGRTKSAEAFFGAGAVRVRGLTRGRRGEHDEDAAREHDSGPHGSSDHFSLSLRSVSLSSRSGTISTPIPAPRGHLDEPLRVQDDRRLDEVLVEVAARLRRVSRQREAVERLEVDVHGPADPGLVHAARPDRDAARGGVPEDPDRLEEPADPPLLQVEDPAAAERDRRPRVGEVVDRLVEAERRRELLLQGGVLVEVAVRERLLDHRQPEGVEPREVRGVLEAVVAVRVDHERDVGEPLPHGRHVVDVLPLLDLHLDPVVARARPPRDLASRGRPGDSWSPRLMPEGIRFRGPPRRSWSGTPFSLRREVDEGVLDRRLRHPVPADVREPGVELAERQARLDERQEELRHDVPRRRRRLGGVERVGVGDALAPADDAARLDPEEERLLARPGRRADRERRGRTGGGRGGGRSRSIGGIRSPSSGKGAAGSGSSSRRSPPLSFTTRRTGIVPSAPTSALNRGYCQRPYIAVGSRRSAARRASAPSSGIQRLPAGAPSPGPASPLHDRAAAVAAVDVVELLLDPEERARSRP